MKKLVILLLAWPASADLRKGAGSNYPHIFIGTKPVSRIYKGNTLIWSNSNAPAITAFSAAPATIDLDTRPTGTITFTINVTGQPAQNTNAQIVRLPHGENIGTTFVAANGANIATTLPNIPQPTATTTYRLFATNTAGASHSDTTVSVTQNAAISNFRRTGFAQNTDGSTGGRYQFTARVQGYPQPAVTWRFGNGAQSQRNNDNIRFTPVAGQTNSWDVVLGGHTGLEHTINSDSLVMTVTNSSNSANATIANISS